jgi:hypothetical protein
MWSLLEVFSHIANRKTRYDKKIMDTTWLRKVCTLRRAILYFSTKTICSIIVDIIATLKMKADIAMK